jgi:trimethylguanosine synthase
MQEKFSKTMQGDDDAIFMSVQEVAAIHIGERLKQYKTCVELCTAVGALAIHIASFIPKVIGVDLDPRRIEDAKANAKIYGVEYRTEFLIGDVLDEELLKSIKADVAILDPDWSAEGTEKSIHTIDIDKMQPSMRQMILLTRKWVTPNLVLRVPKHFTLETLSEFGPYELESIFIDDRMRFKVVYFLPEIETSRETAVYLKGL